MKYFTDLLEINKRFVDDTNNFRMTNLDEFYGKDFDLNEELDDHDISKIKQYIHLKNNSKGRK